MADDAQGPGWWIASDGKWYPPELHPSRMPPPPWGANPQNSGATPRTNGLAIASLVLSLTVFLVGPILAIIFGAIARRQIRESKGGQSGDGLALAGLIIGIVELVVSLVVVAFVVVLIANGSISGLGQRELAISARPASRPPPGSRGGPWLREVRGDAPVNPSCSR
jgi:large-conductance mechanosensitive channel